MNTVVACTANGERMKRGRRGPGTRERHRAEVTHTIDRRGRRGERRRRRRPSRHPHTHTRARAYPLHPRNRSVDAHRFVDRGARARVFRSCFSAARRSVVVVLLRYAYTPELSAPSPPLRPQTQPTRTCACVFTTHAVYIL